MNKPSANRAKTGVIAYAAGITFTTLLAFAFAVIGALHNPEGGEPFGALSGITFAFAVAWALIGALLLEMFVGWGEVPELFDEPEDAYRIGR